MKRDLCIDLETLGTGSNAVIVSIGACTFDPTTLGEIPKSEQFLINIDPESAQQSGGTIDAGTIKWWLHPNNVGAAANWMKEPVVSLTEALRAFIRFVDPKKCRVENVWANSPSFDCVILRHSFDRLNIMWPFHFANERDVRTIKELAWPNRDAPNFNTGTAHDALDDTLAQAKLIKAGYYRLGLSSHTM